jgi:hypothetical protein
MNSQLTSPLSSTLSSARWVWKDSSTYPEWRNFSSEICSLLEERYQLYVQKMAECTSRKERLEVDSKEGFVQFKTNGLSMTLDLKYMHAELLVPKLDGRSDPELVSVGRIDMDHPSYGQKVHQKPLFNILMLAKGKGELLGKGEIKRSEAFIRFQTVDVPLSRDEEDPPSFDIEGYTWTAFKGNSRFLARYLPGLRIEEMILIPSYETSYVIMRHIERLASVLKDNGGGGEHAPDYVLGALTCLGEDHPYKGKEYLPFLVNTRQTLREVLERMVTEGHVDQLLAKKIKDEHPSFLDTILD